MGAQTHQNLLVRVRSVVVAVCLLEACSRVPSGVSGQPPLAAGDLWIRNVTVVSPERPQAVPGSHVIVRNGRIASVTTKEPGGAAAEGTILDGTGKFLTPGLIDGHVHLAGVPGMSPQHEAAQPDLTSAYYAQLPRSYLYFGFTTVVDLNVVDRKQVDRLKAADLGPAILDCDGALALANGYPMAYLPPAVRFERYPNFLFDPRQAASIPSQYSAGEHTPSAAVSRVARAGGVCVKVHYEPGFGDQTGKLPVPTVAVIREVREAARRKKLPVLIHANSLEAHRFAVEADADVAVHGLWNWGQATADAAELPGEVKDVVDAERTNGMRIMPTARVIGGLADLFAPEFLDDPQLTHVLPRDLIAWYKNAEGQWFAREMAQSFDRLPSERVREILRRLQGNGTRAATYFVRNGGRPVFGSDTPSAPTYANPPGYNGFLELMTLESAGISPHQLLTAATTEAADLFGLSRDYGTVEAGKIANLLVLTADPLTSVAAFDKIETVIVKGRPVQRTTLAADRN